jgi:hypothetical protein
MTGMTAPAVPSVQSVPVEWKEAETVRWPKWVLIRFPQEH